MSISGVFDETKNYKELQCQGGQFVAPVDFNHIQDITNWNADGTGIYSTGYGLRVNALVNSPLLKIKANNDLGEGSILTFEMVDATHVKWKTNGGAWSAGIVVVNDGTTWNTVGTSGIDIIFSGTAVAADSSEVWVGKGIRLLGGELELSAGVTYKLNEGKWLLEGRYVELVDDTVLTANGDYVYLSVTESTVAHAVDSDIGHFMYDGNYANKSPIATKLTYDLLASAVFPTSTATVKYVIVGKIINAAGGTFTQMWDTALDIQQLYRLYADTTAPSTPTGLALSSDAEDGLKTAVVGTIKQTETVLGYLKMDCDTNPEPDISVYEFKVCRLDNLHNPTVDVQTILVKLNTDAGGFAIPLGVSHTIHNLTIGVEYRVWVRAIDYAGNVSDWSASVDQFVGDVCDINVLAAAPTVTLTDTVGFVGVTITVTALPVNSAGFTIWVGEGAYPAIASNESLAGHYPAGQGVVYIPWKESGNCYVTVCAFDDAGLYHVDGVGALVTRQASLILAESAQLAAETHNLSPSSHGGSIGDLISCQQPYGTLYRWLNLLSNNAWTPGNVYILAESGSDYTTLDACLTAIGTAAPSEATIFVMPGTYGSGGTVSFPDIACNLTVIGLGKDSCTFTDTINLDDVRYTTTTTNPTLTFENIRFNVKVEGDNTSVVASPKVVSFINCVFDADGVGDDAVYFVANAAGSWYLRFDSCQFFSDKYCFYAESKTAFVISDCLFVTSVAAQTAIYLKTPSLNPRLLKNSGIEVTAIAGGQTIDADGGGPYTIDCYGTAWNQVPNAANITVQAGSVATNTVPTTADFITG